MSRFGEVLAKYGDMSNEERQQLLRQLEDDGVFGFPILFHAARLTYQVEEYRNSPLRVRLKALHELRQDTINRKEVLSEDHQEMTHAAHAGQPSREKSEEGLRRVDQHLADLNAILEFIDEGIKRLESQQQKASEYEQRVSTWKGRQELPVETHPHELASALATQGTQAREEDALLFF